MAYGASADAARKFAFVRGLQRQRKVVVVIMAAISAALLFLTFVPGAGLALPAWVVLPAVGAYALSTLVTLRLLRRLEEQVERGMELLVAEKRYTRTIFLNNLVFVAILFVLLAVAASLSR